MGRLIKLLLVLVAGLAGIVIIAAVALLLFFDPNDFREQISTQVKEQTGRDLVIEGDLSISLFANNIFGNRYAGGAAGIGKDTLGSATSNPTAPGVWGIDLTKHF